MPIKRTVSICLAWLLLFAVALALFFQTAHAAQADPGGAWPLLGFGGLLSFLVKTFIKLAYR